MSVPSELLWTFWLEYRLPCLLLIHLYLKCQSKHGLQKALYVQFGNRACQCSQCKTCKTVADSEVWPRINDFGQILCWSQGMSYPAETGVQIRSKLSRQIWVINGPLKSFFKIYESVPSAKGAFIFPMKHVCDPEALANVMGSCYHALYYTGLFSVLLVLRFSLFLFL